MKLNTLFSVYTEYELGDDTPSCILKVDFYTDGTVFFESCTPDKGTKIFRGDSFDEVWDKYCIAPIHMLFLSARIFDEDLFKILKSRRAKFRIQLKLVKIGEKFTLTSTPDDGGYNCLVIEGYKKSIFWFTYFDKNGTIYCGRSPTHGPAIMVFNQNKLIDAYFTPCYFPIKPWFRITAHGDDVSGAGNRYPLKDAQKKIVYLSDHNRITVEEYTEALVVLYKYKTLLPVTI